MPSPTVSIPLGAVGVRRPRHVKRRPARSAFAWLALVLIAVGGDALAHELRPAVAELGLDDGSVVVELRVNVEAMIAGVGVEHEDTDDSPQATAYDTLRSLDPDTLRTRLDAFLPTLLDALELRRGDGERVSLALLDATLPPVGDVRVARDSTLRLSGAPAGTVTWYWPERFGPTIVRSASPDGPGAFGVYLLAGETSDPLPLGSADGSTGVDRAGGSAPSDAARAGGSSPWSTFVNYVRVGFVHIVPLGLDHILFVVGLFLFAPRAGPMLAQVTLFTLAHSVTLALATLGHVAVPSSVVEPLIALSIAAVCAENLLARRLGGARLAVVFGFGLLHGLGFASVLQDVGGTASAFALSLIAFNVGVEIGQLAVVLACFATVGWWFRDASWYRRVVTVPGSLAIGAVGLWWFVERLLS